MNILYIYVGGMGFIVLCLLFVLIMYFKSFKNHVMIARQTGSDPTNVIWVSDRFKVVDKDGYYRIIFLKRRVRTSDADGKLYTLFFKKKPQGISITKEEWLMKDMSKLVQRGLFMYETNEGQFFPITMEVNNGAKFQVLDQDKRRWITEEIKDIHELTRNRTKDILLLTAAIVACVVLALTFIFGIIYLNEQATKTQGTVQGACMAYIDKIMNYTITIQENNNGVASNLANSIVGG